MQTLSNDAALPAVSELHTLEDAEYSLTHPALKLLVAQPRACATPAKGNLLKYLGSCCWPSCSKLCSQAAGLLAEGDVLSACMPVQQLDAAGAS